MQSDDDKEWKDNFNKDNDNDVMMYNTPIGQHVQVLHF